MNNPLVSIVIPAYNYGSFIQETIQCLIKQSYSNWEAIVIDDGSSDDTASLVAELMKHDHRIKYFYQDNAGLSAARNTGLKKIGGEYVQFLDADDLLSEQKLAIQVSYMATHPEVDISYTTAYYFNSGDQKTLYRSISLTNEDWIPLLNAKGFDMVNRLIEGNIMPVNSALIQRKVIDKIGYFNEKLKSLEDWEFWSRCAFAGFRFAYVEEETAFAIIRTHRNSMSANRRRMLETEIELRDFFNVQVSSLHIDQKARKTLLRSSRIAEKRTYVELINLIGRNRFFDLKNILKKLGLQRFIKYYVKAMLKRG